MDFQRFFDAFEAQTKNVSILTQRVEELRLSNLQLLQAVKKAERLPHVLDPESKKLANRFREQALAYEREVLRQQRAKKMQQIEREMAASKSNTRQNKSQKNDAKETKESASVNSHDFSTLSRVRTRATRETKGQTEGVNQTMPQPIVGNVASTGGMISTSMSTEDELSNTVIAKDRLDFFRQVGSGSTPGERDNMASPGVTGSLLDKVNLDSPSAVTCGHDDVIDAATDAHTDFTADCEDVSACGANTTTGFYTNSTDILQYMRHSTNTITSMFTLQEEEEEELSSRRNPSSNEIPRPPLDQSVTRGTSHRSASGADRGAEELSGERQHLTRYLLEASLPDEDDDIPRRLEMPSSQHSMQTIKSSEQTNSLRMQGRPWETMMEEQFEAQAELGMKLQEEIRAQEERLRAQMQLFNQMRNNSAAIGSSELLRSAEPRSIATPSVASELPRPHSQISPRSLSRHTPYPPVLRSDEDSLRLIHPLPDADPTLPTADMMSDELHAKFCRLSALIKGYLTRQLYHSDRVQNCLRIVKDTAECALRLNENSDVSGTLVNRRQDAYLHSRLVSQLQASLFEFHDIFFATTPAQRMNIIAATRQARLQKLMQLEEKSEFEIEEPVPEKETHDRRTPKLSAATLRRIEMRERGQGNSIISPRYINRPAEKSPPADSVISRPSTAPTTVHHRGQTRVLRPIHPQQQPQKPVLPKTRPNSHSVQRSRSMNTGKVGTAHPSAVPMKRGQSHRMSVPQSNREIRSVHVVTVNDSGRQMTRKIRTVSGVTTERRK